MLNILVETRVTHLFVMLILLFTASHGQSSELGASDEPLDIHSMSDESKDIIWGFMRELELPNPFEKPDPVPPAPTPTPPTPTPTPPKPEPEPTPPIETEDKDDFLWEDDNFLDDKRSFADMQAEFERQYNEIKQRWDKRIEERISIWREPSADFLDFHDAIVSQTEEASRYLLTDDTTPILSSGRSATQRLDRMKPGDFHVIPQSLQIPIRNQAYRGTCVAFAYVRAMESIFATYGASVDLSENHFYFMAKDQCRVPGICACTAEQRKQKNNQCADDGLVLTKTADIFRGDNPSLFTVPESECRYRKFPYPLELTGAPLSECTPFNSPVAKPSRSIVLKQYSQIPDAVLSNQPLVIGVKVSKKMIQKQTSAERQSIGATITTLDGDAEDEGGHAMLGLGVIKLKQKHWRSEGQYCLIVANSWGRKYGSGGYSCFTEKWLRRYMTQAVALASIDVTDNYYPKEVY
jgi:hypothetical protein